jgi:cytochrome c
MKRMQRSGSHVRGLTRSNERGGFAAGVMSGLLFNKIAAGVLVVALVGVGGAEVWRRVSGGGEDHGAPQAYTPHGAEQAAGPAAVAEASAVSAPAATPGEAIPAAVEGSASEEAALATAAPEAGAAAKPDAPVAAAEAAPAAPAGPDYPALFAAANVEDGKTLSVKCAMCHDFTDAKKTLVGPPLYDLFGRDVASLPGVNYSAGPGSLSSVAGEWDAEKLDRFLENPKKFAPATFMALPGMNKDAERIALMAYIRSLTAGEPKPVE